MNTLIWTLATCYNCQEQFETPQPTAGRMLFCHACHLKGK